MRAAIFGFTAWPFGRHARAYWRDAERRTYVHGYQPRHRAGARRADVPVDLPSSAAATYGGKHRQLAS